MFLFGFRYQSTETSAWWTTLSKWRQSKHFTTPLEWNGVKCPVCRHVEPIQTARTFSSVSSSLGKRIGWTIRRRNNTVCFVILRHSNRIEPGQEEIVGSALRINEYNKVSPLHQPTQLLRITLLRNYLSLFIQAPPDRKPKCQTENLLGLIYWSQLLLEQ